MIKRRTGDEVIGKFLEGVKDAGLMKSIGKMYLFGSRARGDERPDSDYDLLIVADQLDREFRNKLYDIAVDIFLATGRDISLKIYKTQEFRRLRRMQTPFMRNVLQEGIRIG
jgi:predicted nucleotidyltransferase